MHEIVKKECKRIANNLKDLTKEELLREMERLRILDYSLTEFREDENNKGEL